MGGLYTAWAKMSGTICPFDPPPGNVKKIWHKTPVPGGKITFATPGFFQAPWDNPLNVDPLVLASISAAGPINFSVVLNSAQIAKLNLAATILRNGNRTLTVGIEALDPNVIRIDNILFERFGAASE